MYKTSSGNQASWFKICYQIYDREYRLPFFGVSRSEPVIVPFRGTIQRVFSSRASVSANYLVQNNHKIVVILGGSVAEWLACRTQARKSTGSNRSRGAVE